jgi:hypothetical protein
MLDPWVETANVAKISTSHKFENNLCLPPSVVTGPQPAGTSFSLPHLIGRMEGQTPHPTQGLQGSVSWCDAKADVPSTERPRVQLAFKNSMVYGILQFTPSIIIFATFFIDARAKISVDESYVFS